MPLLSCVERFRMQLRCVNRTKSARRSASACRRELFEPGVLNFMAGFDVHLSGLVREHSLCGTEPNKVSRLWATVKLKKCFKAKLNCSETLKF